MVGCRAQFAVGVRPHERRSLAPHLCFAIIGRKRYIQISAGGMIPIPSIPHTSTLNMLRNDTDTRQAPVAQQHLTEFVAPAVATRAVAQRQDEAHSR
jgi:hypothetical protein